jgi:Phosphodiester glycosidase
VAKSKAAIRSFVAVSVACCCRGSCLLRRSALAKVARLPLQSALLFFAVAATAQANWRIISADSEPGKAGVVHRHVVLEDSGANETATIDLALFSAKSCTLRVIDQPTLSRGDLARLMQQQRCLAGVNGGYFDPDFAPIGLRIVNEQMMAPLQRARLTTGVLFASSRGVQIMRTREFSRRPKVTAAIQCGPFLVDLAQRVPGLNDSHLARRTFAATATGHWALLGVCSEVSLAELAKILATTQFAGDLKIERALNLDGGSSSAFWFARENGSAFSIPEQKTVRDFVAIVPK